MPSNPQRTVLAVRRRAAGYDVSAHSLEAPGRVAALVGLMRDEGWAMERFCGLRTCLDRITLAGTWGVVHQPYAKGVFTVRRALRSMAGGLWTTYK